jgi:hypothetical protein
MDENNRAGYFRGKAQEYRAKALNTADLRVKLALEAVAREYSCRAGAVDRGAGTKPDMAGVPRSKPGELRSAPVGFIVRR